jgi:hypothetical protein
MNHFPDKPGLFSSGNIAYNLSCGRLIDSELSQEQTHVTELSIQVRRRLAKPVEILGAANKNISTAAQPIGLGGKQQSVIERKTNRLIITTAAIVPLLP